MNNKKRENLAKGVLDQLRTHKEQQLETFSKSDFNYIVFGVRLEEGRVGLFYQATNTQEEAQKVVDHMGGIDAFGIQVFSKKSEVTQK